MYRIKRSLLTVNFKLNDSFFWVKIKFIDLNLVMGAEEMKNLTRLKKERKTFYLLLFEKQINANF